ncbi:MAG: TonB-dependent receptor [Bacteroidales bacterium]|nr:TonB-dependent receptor [Bacteroidales bacterium]
MTPKRLLLYLTLTLPLAAWGQGVVEGVVRDASGNGTLEYVNIGIIGRSGGTVTDARGHYRLEIPSADSVTLRYSFTGFRHEERRIALRGGRILKMNVLLSPLATVLGEVEISEEQNRQSSFTQIDIQKLENTTGPTGGVENLLKLLPDVHSNNELSSQYSVRGGSFDENLVYINDVEVFRPMLIRSGQQEGMSIINPDLVDYILFSPGGFDASYGDKLSSVLDITYSRPRHFHGKASASLLGATATVQGRAGERWSYAAGLRRHSNQYILGSLDTKGSYTTAYTDLQALLGFKVNERLDLGALAIWTHNIYGLVPESQTTTFGSYFMPLVLRIYFDGQEQDRYNTLLGAFTADWRPTDDWHITSSLSLQHINESERYDVQSQYWLYEVTTSGTGNENEEFDRGVGTFLEHARNRLATDLAALNLKASRYARLGNWNFGLKLQLENIDDHLREWRWVDSAGYALPTQSFPYGNASNGPASPILQQYANSNHTMSTWRTSGYVQRELNLYTRRQSDIKVLAGIRGQIYANSVAQTTRFFLSPRASVNYKPKLRHDMLFRIAAGIYQQPPFYREYRTPDGTLFANLPPQESYQATGSLDWNFRLWNKPFTLTADLYYKYLSHLIPYTVDNLRLRYQPDQSAVGYATGLSIRLNGELVKGLESWASLGIMRTQEDIEGDGLGWLDRPTDQRLSFKLFLQDNIPDMPWWRMSLNLIYATGMPVSIPMAGRTEESFRLPSYYRVDWGNTIRLSQFSRLQDKRIFHYVEDIQVSLEIFNLFNFRNVVSYLWVSDYENRFYPVPNYLTSRQLNLKLTVLF